MQIRSGYAAAMFAALPVVTLAAALALLSRAHTPPLTAPSTIEHVVVISVDGLRPR